MKRPVVAIACAVLLLGIALWEIVATRVMAAGVPGDGAWAAAAQVVRAEFRPGDLITFAPGWIDPTGRMHLGDLISIDDAARMDDARYARVWELSIRGAARDEKPAFEREVEGVRVRRYDRTPAKVVGEIRALPGATRVLAEVGFAPHRCWQVVPGAQPVRMKATLPAGKLVGYAGLADVFTRRDIRAPATLEVEVGGKIVASVSPGVDDGWVRFEAAIPAGEVTFVAKAAAPQRLLCFAAEVRE